MDDFERLERENERLRSRLAELEEREQRFSATLYGIGDGMIATDALGRITQLNQVAAQLTGWEETEAERNPILLPV